MEIRVATMKEKAKDRISLGTSQTWPCASDFYVEINPYKETGCLRRKVFYFERSSRFRT